MKRDDLMEVYATTDGSQAHIVCNALHAEGIACEMDGEFQAAYTGLSVVPVKLLVRAEDFDRASKYIELHHR